MDGLLPPFPPGQEEGPGTCLGPSRAQGETSSSSHPFRVWAQGHSQPLPPGRQLGAFHCGDESATSAAHTWQCPWWSFHQTSTPVTGSDAAHRSPATGEGSLAVPELIEAYPPLSWGRPASAWMCSPHVSAEAHPGPVFINPGGAQSSVPSSHGHRFKAGREVSVQEPGLTDQERTALLCGAASPYLLLPPWVTLLGDWSWTTAETGRKAQVGN